MAEEFIGAGPRDQREDLNIQREPTSSLEEQQEMDRRRMENAALASQGVAHADEKAMKEQKRTDHLNEKASTHKTSGQPKHQTQENKSGTKAHRHHTIPPH